MNKNGRDLVDASEIQEKKSFTALFKAFLKTCLGSEPHVSNISTDNFRKKCLTQKNIQSKGG